jgi:hypothetical protein
MNKLLTIFLFISLGITSFKLFDILYLYEIVIIYYVIYSIARKGFKKVTGVNIQVLLIYLFYSIIISLISLLYDHRVEFLEVIFSTTRFTLYIILAIILLKEFIDNPLFIFKCLQWAVYFHLIILISTWFLHTTGFIFNDLLLISNWSNNGFIGNGVLKVFEYPIGSRYSGLFEEPSHFNLLIILFIIVKKKINDFFGTKFNFKDFLLLLIVLILTRSIGGTIVLIFIFLLFNHKKFIKIILPLITVLLIFLFFQFDILSIISEIPRVTDVLSGEDKSVNVRLFQNTNPILELTNKGYLFFGTGLGNSALLLSDFTSQILYLTLLLETGLIGFVIFMFLFLYKFFNNLKWRLIMILVGFLNGFLIAPITILLISHLLFDKKICLSKK